MATKNVTGKAKKKAGKGAVARPPRLAPVEAAAPVVALLDRVVAVLKDAADHPDDANELSTEEIGERLTGEWTYPELYAAIGRGIETGVILGDADQDADGPPLYSLAAQPTAPPAPAPPSPPSDPADEDSIHTAALAALDRLLADPARPQETRVLEVILSEAERANVRLEAEDAAIRADAKRGLVSRLAGELKDAKAELAAASSERDRAHRIARAGKDHRPVVCYELKLWREGVAVTIREDTREEIPGTRRPLDSAAERQGDLL